MKNRKHGKIHSGGQKWGPTTEEGAAGDSMLCSRCPYHLFSISSICVMEDTGIIEYETRSAAWIEVEYTLSRLDKDLPVPDLSSTHIPADCGQASFPMVPCRLLMHADDRS